MSAPYILCLTNQSLGFNIPAMANKALISEAARVLGSRTTPKKAKAARENGKKGGRPRKKAN